MKKILFLTVPLVSLLIFLFCMFDSSLFQNQNSFSQEKEITKIGDSTHFLIFDTTYTAGSISENSLRAYHNKEGAPNSFYRSTTDLNRVYATYKNDSLKLIAYAIVGASVETLITKNNVKSTAKVDDCTYTHRYKPLKSKIIINSKTLNFSDSLDVYFDMSFVYTEENGKYIDTMVVQGTTRMGKRINNSNSK